jgi:hypothetical protein
MGWLFQGAAGRRLFHVFAAGRRIFHGHAALKAGVSGVFRAIGHGSAA